MVSEKFDCLSFQQVLEMSARAEAGTDYWVVGWKCTNQSSGPWWWTRSTWTEETQDTSAKQAPPVGLGLDPLQLMSPLSL